MLQTYYKKLLFTSLKQVEWGKIYITALYLLFSLINIGVFFKVSLIYRDEHIF